MEDAANDIVLEHLRHIRSKVDSMDTTLRELINRPGRLEIAVAQLHMDFAGLSVRIDNMAFRVTRIESRLQLAEGDVNAGG